MQGLTTDKILLLANLIHFNPRAWQAIEGEVNDDQILSAQELSGHRILITAGHQATKDTRKFLVCLDTCKVIDRA